MPGDVDSGNEMVAGGLCSIFDVAVAVDNCFVADSCFVVSADVAGGGGAAGSYIVGGVGGGGDGGEGPHPPRSTYQTVNTSLKTSKCCQSSLPNAYFLILFVVSSSSK